MKLSDKIRYLREVEGSLRGLGRAMTQQETVKAIAESEAEARVRPTSQGRDIGMGHPNSAKGKGPRAKKEAARAATKTQTISQSYLSQIESGARPHLTNTTRLLLARFFKVHPGYLVDDPEGYHAELMSDVRTVEDKLDLWLIAGAERFRRDSELCHALLTLSRHEDSRRCLLLLESVLETPELVDRLLQVLRPERSVASAESVSQRLKPPALPGIYGTAEAVPLSKTKTAAKGAGAVSTTAEAVPISKTGQRSGGMTGQRSGGKREIE
jgi:transcriptional regulator with XRE-family HTH domain